jgi:Holliday junction DNA helicase RuvB
MRPTSPIVGGSAGHAALAEADAALDAELLALDARHTVAPAVAQPAARGERSKNLFRPHHLDDVIGQDHAKSMMKRMIDRAAEQNRPLPHVLLVAASGTGKTTFAHVIAEELGVDVFQCEAPVDYDTLLELREVMQRGDVLFADEIHQQAAQERRGRNTGTGPEVLFSLMEDRVILTPTGPLPFPEITVIGATTDEGQLPDAFVNRFKLQPHLEAYTVPELIQIVFWNARLLGLEMDSDAAALMAGASRGVPRQINSFVDTADLLADQGGRVTLAVAKEVLSFQRVTEDGLTADMVKVLVYLLTKCRRENKKDGDVRYQASVGSIATAIGKSRDQKAIALRVEPYLIEQGYLQVGHGGRLLTDAGIQRAREILQGVKP